MGTVISIIVILVVAALINWALFKVLRIKGQIAGILSLVIDIVAIVLIVKLFV